MPRNSKCRSSSMADQWVSLTWDDLAAWAGSRSVSRGRAYQRQGYVQELAASPEGRLIATVHGTEAYATSVWLKSDQETKEKDSLLQSCCTCPVGDDGCKHAVAVVAEYLQRLADEAEVNVADPNDPRWAMMDDESLSNQSSFLPQGGNDREWNEKIQRHIRAKSHEELMRLVESLTQRFPELYEEFEERIMLGEGDADRLITEAQRELQDVTAQPGWRHHWSNEGWIPDYSRLNHRLERLVELGHADAVVTLGRQIIDRGMEQVDQSDDEGETAMALGKCLSIVFDAVAQSGLSVPEKLLFAIDASLRDEYGVLDNAKYSFFEAEYAPAAWSAVADELVRRLETVVPGKDNDFHSRYARDGIANWLVQALEEAGREDEILTLYECEARITGSYRRLVRFLIDHKQFDDAQRWAEEGIEKTRDPWPGVASGLADMMDELAQHRGRWDISAAYAAQKFFERPSSKAFEELIAVAEKIKTDQGQGKDGNRSLQEQVRQAALHFLETGEAPFHIAESKQQKRRLVVDPDWPLPMPDDLAASMRATGHTQPRPYYNVLLDMAIADGRTDDVLHWYARLREQDQGAVRGWFSPDSYADRVAEAVASPHPQTALDIYRQRLDANLKHASTSAYETCGAYLKKMRPIMESLDQEGQWTKLLDDIRTEYRRRPRFMEVLDRLGGRTVIQSRQARKKPR